MRNNGFNINNKNRNNHFLNDNKNNKNLHIIISSSHIKQITVIKKKPNANGLKNVGATCYMNANLQCFGHIERLTKYFLRSNKIEEISWNKTNNKLICE